MRLARRSASWTSLSREVEARAESLLASLAALARADLWLARARLAAQMDAVRPAVTDDAAELLSARHPLLGPAPCRSTCAWASASATAPGGHRAEHRRQDGVAQDAGAAGAHAPGRIAGAAADGARLPAFSRVMADIGDEQSIAQSLSTFSSHLRNVVRFVAAAEAGTLVLLDEIGAGTDPTEGSALAMAVVERLLQQGAWVAATTHYAELKTFAQEHPLVSNASVAFDVAT